jgi:hypothetical protein
MYAARSRKSSSFRSMPWRVNESKEKSGGNVAATNPQIAKLYERVRNLRENSGGLQSYSGGAHFSDTTFLNMAEVQYISNLCELSDITMSARAFIATHVFEMGVDIEVNGKSVFESDHELHAFVSIFNEAIRMHAFVFGFYAMERVLCVDGVTTKLEILSPLKDFTLAKPIVKGVESLWIPIARDFLAKERHDFDNVKVFFIYPPDSNGNLTSPAKKAAPLLNQLNSMTKIDIVAQMRRANPGFFLQKKLPKDHVDEIFFNSDDPVNVRVRAEETNRTHRIVQESVGRNAEESKMNGSMGTYNVFMGEIDTPFGQTLLEVQRDPFKPMYVLPSYTEIVPGSIVAGFEDYERKFEMCIARICAIFEIPFILLYHTKSERGASTSGSQETATRNANNVIMFYQRVFAVHMHDAALWLFQDRMRSDVAGENEPSVVPTEIGGSGNNNDLSDIAAFAENLGARIEAQRKIVLEVKFRDNPHLTHEDLNMMKQYNVIDTSEFNRLVLQSVGLNPDTALEKDQSLKQSAESSAAQTQPHE